MAVLAELPHIGIYVVACESASNLDPTPIEHQIIEAEAELLILGVFDRRPTVTPSSFSKIVWLQPVTAVWSGVKVGRRFTPWARARFERQVPCRIIGSVDDLNRKNDLARNCLASQVPNSSLRRNAAHSHGVEVRRGQHLSGFNRRNRLG